MFWWSEASVRLLRADEDEASSGLAGAVRIKPKLILVWIQNSVIYDVQFERRWMIRHVWIFLAAWKFDRLHSPSLLS